MKILLVLTVCLMAAAQQLTFDDPLKVYRADLVNSLPGTPLRGSMMGGAILAIQGTGFDAVGCNHQVLVGSLVCSTAGLPCSSDTIMCQMPTSLTALQSQAISVTIEGKGTTTCSSAHCLFSYSKDSTPLLTDLANRSVIPGQKTELVGYHKVSNPGNNSYEGDIRQITIGDHICSRSQSLDGILGLSDWGRVSCKVPEYIAGGFYTISSHSYWGYAETSQHITNQVFFSNNTNRPFDILVHPSISELSSQTGSTKGTLLTIKGSGFGSDPQKVSATVAGVPCVISSLAPDSITCLTDEVPTSNYNDGKILNGSANRVKPYIAGAGAQIKKYNISALTTKTVAGIRADLALTTPVSTESSSGTTLSLREENLGSNVATVIKGYFKPPTTGSLKFSARSDSQLVLYVSSVYGTATVDYTTANLQVAGGSSPAASSASAITVANVEHHYYFELYHISSTAGSYFSVAAEISGGVSVSGAGAYEVQTVKIQAETLVKERLAYKQTVATGGTITFSLERNDSSTGLLTYSKTATVPFDATEAQFLAMLNTFDIFAPYSPSVTRTMKNEAGAVITTGTPYSITWAVQMSKWRPTAIRAQSLLVDITKLTGPAGATPSVAIDSSFARSHSTPIGGTIKLSYDGLPAYYFDEVTKAKTASTDIPVTVSTDSLRRSFVDAWGCSSITVEKPATSNSQVELAFTVSWTGCPGAKETISTTGSVLLSGNTIAVTQNAIGSNAIAYSPVSSYVMRVASVTTQVTVTVDEAPSVCTASSCDLALSAPTLEVTSFTLDENAGTLRIQTTDSASPTQLVELDKITVYLNDKLSVSAQGATGTYADFTITLPKNVDNTVDQEMATYAPRVLFGSRQIATNSGSAGSVDITMEITSVSPTSIPDSGGINLDIIGGGFPSNSDRTGFTVSICGENAQIISSTTGRVKVVSPPCSVASTAATVTYQGVTTTPSPSITVDDTSSTKPTITSTTMTIYPLEKSTINIVGTNFDTTANNFRAFLTTGTERRRVKQLKWVSNTATTAQFEYDADIPFGDYKLVVHNNGVSSSTDDITVSVKFQLTNIEGSSPGFAPPVNGSVITVGTVQPANFGPYKLIFKLASGSAWDNSDLNHPTYCKFFQVTSSQSRCRLSLPPDFTPQLDVDYNAYLVLDSKYVANQNCGGSQCKLQFTSALELTKNITGNVNVVPGAAETVTGTNFKPDPSFPPKVWIGSHEATITSSSDTSISFDCPKLPSGSYESYIQQTKFQTTSSRWVSVYALSVDSISKTTGSINGARIDLAGKGLHPISDPLTKLKVTGATVVKFTERQYVSNNDKLVVDFIALTPSPAANETIVVSYEYNGTVFEFNYVADIDKQMTLAAASAEESYQSSTVTTLDFTVTTTLTLSSSIDTIVYYLVGATNDIVYGEIKTLPVTWDAMSSRASISKSDFDTLKGGSYCFHLLEPAVGFTNCAQFKITPPVLADLTLPSQVDASYMSGPFFQITSGSLGVDGTLFIEQIPVPMTSQSAGLQKFKIPSYAYIDSKLVNATDMEMMKPNSIIADDTTIQANLADGKVQTVYSTTGNECKVYLKYDRPYLVGAIRLFVPYSASSPSVSYRGFSIKGTKGTDHLTAVYTDIIELDNKVHYGWNTFRLSTPLGPFKTLLFSQGSSSNPQTSDCKFSELQSYGYATGLTVVDSSNRADLTASASLVLPDQSTFNLNGIVHYKSSVTPTITGVSPRYVSWATPTQVTITGSGFGTTLADVVVKTDNVACTVLTVIDTQITCRAESQVGEVAGQGVFEVYVADRKANSQGHSFRYVSLWSLSSTWNRPSSMTYSHEGADLTIAAGKTVLVDKNNLNLGQLTVEGTLIIDELSADLLFKAKSITINRGTLIVGHQNVELAPLTRKITIKLTGTRQTNQITKAIVCNSCNLQLYGNVVANPWSKTASTTTLNSLSLDGNLDWQADQDIVIGPSLHRYSLIQSRTISAITSGATTDVTVGQDLTVIRQRTTGTTNIPYEVGAEVALKNRNVMITGETDSADPLFGARIIVNGPLADLNKRVVIRDVQMLGCGQVYEQMGSCIHFNNNGDAAGSSVERVIAGDTNSRMLTLTVVRHLKVSQNVGYNVLGHGIVLETGAEYSNQIEGNLLMRLKSNPQMGGTDVAPAGIWLSNPQNVLTNNIVAGSDSDGIVYNLSPTSIDSGYSSSICPQGLPLGTVNNNLIHSSKRYGLKIENYAPRDNPCAEIGDSNPAVQSVFSGFVISSVPVGVYAPNIGQVDFTSLTIGDYNTTSMWFDNTARRTTPVLITSTAFIITNIENNLQSPNRQLIPPASQALHLISCKQANSQPITVYLDFGTKEAPSFINTAYTIDGSKPTGQIFTLKWNANKTNIIYDNTGSLAKLADGVTRPNGAILVPSYPHLVASGVCPEFTAGTLMNWDPTVICNDGIKAQLVTFKSAVPTTLRRDTAGASLKIHHLATAADSLASVTTGFSTIDDRDGQWTAPLLYGKTYAVWWDSNIEFKSVTVSLSPHFSDSSRDAIILRFNHTEVKESVDIAKLLEGVIQQPLITASRTPLNAATCVFGDYYHDKFTRNIFVCISDKSRTVNELQLTTTSCKFLCDDNSTNPNKEYVIRTWSNATQWPGQVVPAAGDNVTIPSAWTVKLDVNPPALNSLIIEGQLFIDERDSIIETKFMWVKGKFWAGTQSLPFTKTLSIKVLGQSAAGTNYTFGGQSANKLIVVTGNMTLYSDTNIFPFSVLAGKVEPNQTTAISLDTAYFGQTLNWAADDEIIIAPSFSPVQYSFVTAASVTATSVTPKTDSKPTYTHYGKATSNTPVDMRSMVGHLTRKIKIVSGTNSNNYGFRVLVTTIADKKGSVTFHGVQFVEGGQPDSEKAALHFQDTIDNSVLSLVEKCSFVKCSGNCLRLVNNANVTINMNVFAEGRNVMVYAQNQQSYVFNQNVMIGARIARSLESSQVISQEVTCYYQSSSAKLAAGEVNIVRENYCFGSQLRGFVIPFNPCEVNSSLNGFENNTVGVAQVGVYFNGQNESSCQSASYVYGFNNKMGIIANPINTTYLKLSHIYLADNELGVSVRPAYTRKNSANITTVIENSIISTASRSDCTYCYGNQSTNCTAARAIRHGPSTYNGSHLQNEDISTTIDGINSITAYDSKLLLLAVEFKNFKSSNTGNLATCTGKVFEIHSEAVDAMGSVNLIDSLCTNCELPKSLVTFPIVQDNLECDGYACFGLANYYIRDSNEAFGSGVKFYVPSNTSFSTPEGCTANQDISGFLCNRSDISVLQFESISRDYRNRTVWPIYIAYDSAQWTSTIVGPENWINQRQASRFSAMLISDKSYKMTFNGSAPVDMRFSLQQKSNVQQPNEYMVINIQYPVRNAAVSIFVNDVKKNPLLLSDESTNFTTTDCGANRYFKENSTISFLVTNSPTCEVRTKLVSSIMIVTTLSSDLQAFLDNGGIAKFKTQVALFLNILQSRVNVLRVRSGSTIVEYQVTENINSTVDNSTQETTTVEAMKEQLLQLANTVETQGASMNTDGLGSVLGVSTTLSVINSDGSSFYTTPEESSKPEDRTGLIVGLVVGILGGAALAVGIYLLVRNYYKPIANDKALPDVSHDKIYPDPTDMRAMNNVNEIV